MHINSASCSFSDCFLQITFVALFHGLSYHFLSFISSPLSLGLIDGQWLPVWSLLMSLIFQPHQSVSVPFKSHQMRWEPLEPRCAGHWDIGSGLIPPQRTQTHVHTQTQIHTRTKTYRSGLFFSRLGYCTGNCLRLNEKRRDESIWVSYRLYSPQWPQQTLSRLTCRNGRGNEKSSWTISRFKLWETHRTCHITMEVIWRTDSSSRVWQHWLTW